LGQPFVNDRYSHMSGTWPESGAQEKKYCFRANQLRSDTGGKKKGGKTPGKKGESLKAKRKKIVPLRTMSSVTLRIGGTVLHQPMGAANVVPLNVEKRRTFEKGTNVLKVLKNGAIIGQTMDCCRCGFVQQKRGRGGGGTEEGGRLRMGGFRCQPEPADRSRWSNIVGKGAQNNRRVAQPNDPRVLEKAKHQQKATEGCCTVCNHEISQPTSRKKKERIKRGLEQKPEKSKLLPAGCSSCSQLDQGVGLSQEIEVLGPRQCGWDTPLLRDKQEEFPST